MEGVSQYQKTIRKDDFSDRGRSRSKLEKEITLVFNREATLIPRYIPFNYYNPDEDSIETISPGIRNKSELRVFI